MMTADLRTAGLIATIPVADLERARVFYEGVLGFAYVATSEAGGSFALGMGGCSSIGATRRHRSDSPPPGHTLAGFEVDRLEPVIKRLKARGVAFEDYDVPALKTVAHVAWIGPERAAWFRDSEGNILSISEAWR